MRMWTCSDRSTNLDFHSHSKRTTTGSSDRIVRRAAARQRPGGGVYQAADAPRLAGAGPHYSGRNEIMNRIEAGWLGRIVGPATLRMYRRGRAASLSIR